MKKLLNTLYITSPGKYLSLDGENIVVLADGEEVARVPMHNIEGIVTFGYTGASPALMGYCAKNNISLSFLTQSGKFLAEVTGEVKGNVTLRKTQYRVSDDEAASAEIARNMIIGKVSNSRWVLERATRDHPGRVDAGRLKKSSAFLQDTLHELKSANTLERIRGFEGNAASQYFDAFDDLILRNKECFFFRERNRRPPLDNVNAMLSFAYTLLANMVSAALSSVGLDPYVGFLHRDRPGRASLALDLMEELRPVMADRFVLTMINKQVVSPGDFVQKENGAVLLTDDARRNIINAWQNKKQEKIKHPFLDEKMEWGLIPYAQAMLLARFLRGDMDAYPPFLWK